MFVSEIIVYISYVYSCIILFINIKPNIIRLILFYIYCFYTTWLIKTGCKHILMTTYITKILITTQYSLICTACYYIINKTWNIYKYNPLYISGIILLPLIYTLTIKISEDLMECSKYNAYNKLYLFYLNILSTLGIDYSSNNKYVFK